MRLFPFIIGVCVRRRGAPAVRPPANRAIVVPYCHRGGMHVGAAIARYHFSVWNPGCAVADRGDRGGSENICLAAVATVLEKIGPEFEKSTGNKLNVITGLSSEFAARINANEPSTSSRFRPRSLAGQSDREQRQDVVVEARRCLARLFFQWLVRARRRANWAVELSGWCFKRNQRAFPSRSTSWAPVPSPPKSRFRRATRRLKLQGRGGVGHRRHHSGLHGAGGGDCRTSASGNSVLYGVWRCGQCKLAGAGSRPRADQFPQESTAIPVIKEQGMEPI